MTEQTLKPCPFCGEQPSVVREPRLWVGCMQSVCAMPYVGGSDDDNDMDVLIELWNRRSATYQLGEAVEALRALGFRRAFSALHLDIGQSEAKMLQKVLFEHTPAEIMAAVKEVEDAK